MGYVHLTALFEFLTWGVLGGAAFIVFLKAATGGINLRGLLTSKEDGPGFSTTRVQLLFTTLVGAFGYLGFALNNIASCTAKGCSLPGPPTEVLALLGGSHALYLGAKGLTASDWLARLRGNRE
jgi:hypothetical protein